MARSPTTIMPRTTLREVKITLSQHKNEPPMVTLVGTPTMGGNTRLGMQSEVKITTHHLSPLGRQWLDEMMAMFGGDQSESEQRTA